MMKSIMSQDKKLVDLRADMDVNHIHLLLSKKADAKTFTAFQSRSSVQIT